MQVGASNELPESEELDALYDRFLLRRRVQQVSQAGLLEMLGNGGGRKQVCGAWLALAASGDGSGGAVARQQGRGAASRQRHMTAPCQRHACPHARLSQRCTPAALAPPSQAIALRSPGTQGLQSVDDPADQPLLTADDFNHTR